MREGTAPTIERGLDGTTTEYQDMAVAGDEVERLLVELFTEHWAELTVGPLIEGAAYEIQFATPPKITMLDGYLTVDTGAWHFHLCVNDHRGTRSEAPCMLRVAGRGRSVASASSGGLPARRRRQYSRWRLASSLGRAGCHPEDSILRNGVIQIMKLCRR